MNRHLLIFILTLALTSTACESPQQASDETTQSKTAMESGAAESAQATAGDGEAETGDIAAEGDTTNTELNQAMELGLIITDTKVGDGEEATAGQMAVVHYTGWLYDESQPGKKGQKFDSSHDRGKPYVFPLGTGSVIKGWDLGVVGMKVGGQRTLIIPSQLGYGERGIPGGPIPGGATLVFDVELLDLQ